MSRPATGHDPAPCESLASAPDASGAADAASGARYSASGPGEHSDHGEHSVPINAGQLAHHGAALSALPPRWIRAVAFGCVVAASVCGGLAGFAWSELSCTDACTAQTLVVASAGSASTAVGTAAVAALVLRSTSEWTQTAGVGARRSRARRTGPQPPVGAGARASATP